MQLSPLLLLHICAGTLGLMSGTVAISVRKGSRSHAIAGIVFSISMLTLASTGAYIAYLKSQTSNVLAGVLTFYMIATAWMAARRGVSPVLDGNTCPPQNGIQVQFVLCWSTGVIIRVLLATRNFS